MATTTATERGYANPDAIVDVAWLKEHADAPDVRVVEVDVDTELYDAGHVEGAVGWNWTTELNDPVRRDIPTPEAFAELLSRSGITPETTVVLYGDNHNWFAAFAAWLLEYHGHDRVKLVDGGRKAVEAAGLPLVKDRPDVPRTEYPVPTVRGSLRAVRDDVLANVETRDAALIDVRSPQEFTGEVLAPPGLSETAQRGGHVPGAANVPWAKAVNADGTLKPRDELEALYGPLVQGRDVITYCRIGERSAHSWFVLRHLLGYENVRNYDGSWTEYGNLVGVPVETGPAPGA